MSEEVTQNEPLEYDIDETARAGFIELTELHRSFLFHDLLFKLIEFFLDHFFAFSDIPSLLMRCAFACVQITYKSRCVAQSSIGAPKNGQISK